MSQITSTIHSAPPLRMPSISESWSEYCQTCNGRCLKFSSIIEGELFCSPKCASSAAEICVELDKALQSDDRVPQFRHQSMDNQITLNVTQKILETATSERHRIRRIVMKLSLDCGSLPASLFLQGVNCSDREAFAVGGFADIFRGTYNHGEVALKRLRVFQAIEPSRRKALEKDFLRESIMWQSLKHEHVLPFLGVDNTVFQQAVCMVLPWMLHGSIRDVIDSWKPEHNGHNITSSALAPQVHVWLREITRGLCYLHEERIVHGDLRGANILVDAEWKVRLADFGLSVFAESMSNAHSSKREGNVRWLAPEILDPERFGKISSRPTYESDVYAFGIVCVELYLGQAPMADKADIALVRHVIEGSRPERPQFVIGGQDMPDELWQLAERSWALSADDRPDAEELTRLMSAICGLDTQARFYSSRARLDGIPYDCSWPGCSSTFTRAQIRDEHQRTHPHLPGYTCDLCDDDFPRLSAWHTHLKNNSECQEYTREVRSLKWQAACDAYQKGFHVTALQLFSSVQEHSTTFVNRGIVLDALGRCGGAIDEYERAMALGHNSAFLEFQYGVSLFFLENYDAASDRFDRALDRLNGLAAINYMHVGLDYTLFASKIMFNKGICLARLDQDEGYTIVEKAALEMLERSVPDDRDEVGSIYVLPAGLSFQPPDERYHDL